MTKAKDLRRLLAALEGHLDLLRADCAGAQERKAHLRRRQVDLVAQEGEVLGDDRFYDPAVFRLRELRLLHLDQQRRDLQPLLSKAAMDLTASKTALKQAMRTRAALEVQLSALGKPADRTEPEMSRAMLFKLRARNQRTS